MLVNESVNKVLIGFTGKINFSSSDLSHFSIPKENVLLVRELDKSGLFINLK
jgi:hypothetical protein